MKKNLYFYSNLLAWALVLFLIGNYAFGWTTPTGNPPDGNLPAPINVSSTAQSKEGYLAIGTSTAPEVPLHVVGNVFLPSGYSYWIGSHSDSGDRLRMHQTGTHSYIDYATGNLNIRAGTATKVLIDSSGNVGIGTTSPGYKLDVSGTGRFTDNITALGFFYSSDETLKENIQKIETPLAKIMKLDGISFNWKENNEKSIGLIAQDVEKVFPEIVETDEETGLKSIEYAKLVAPLIEAVKEQQKMIDEQREIIDKQGEEIKSLKVSLGQS